MDKRLGEIPKQFTIAEVSINGQENVRKGTVKATLAAREMGIVNDTGTGLPVQAWVL